MARNLRRRRLITAAALGLGLAAAPVGMAAAQTGDHVVFAGSGDGSGGGLTGGSGAGGLLSGLLGGLTGGGGTSGGPTSSPTGGTGGTGGSGSTSGVLGGGGATGGLDNPAGTLAGAVNDALGKVTLSVPLLQELSGAAGPNSKPTLTIDQARTKLFGADWANPNMVRGRSVGNTTWLFDYGGTIVLNDSTIEDQLTDTGANKNTNGYVSLGDVIAAKPAAIFQDHTHFDQEHNAAELAVTGIPLVTDLGGCLWTRAEALKKGLPPALVKCNLIRDEDGRPFFTTDTWALGPYAGQGLLGLTPFGAIGHPESPLPGGLTDEVVMVKHSPSFYGRPYPEELSGPVVDPLRSAQEIIDDYKGASPTDIAGSIYSQYAPFDLEGSNVLHKITYRGFSVVHHGSTGPTNNLEPGGAAIAQSLKTLSTPGHPVDVEIGGVAEMTFLLNGHNFTDQKKYSEDIGAKMYFPTHHYDWYPVWLTNPAATYYAGMKATWEQGNEETGGKMPQMCYLVEKNYASVFNWDVRQWQGDNKGPVTVSTGPGCYTG